MRDVSSLLLFYSITYDPFCSIETKTTTFDRLVFVLISIFRGRITIVITILYGQIYHTVLLSRKNLYCTRLHGLGKNQDTKEQLKNYLSSLSIVSRTIIYLLFFLTSAFPYAGRAGTRVVVFITTSQRNSSSQWSLGEHCDLAYPSFSFVDQLAYHLWACSKFRGFPFGKSFGRSSLYLVFKTHFDPIGDLFTGHFTNSQTLLLIKPSYPCFMASFHFSA